jgi:hypothetical protein
MSIASKVVAGNSPIAGGRTWLRTIYANTVFWGPTHKVYVSKIIAIDTQVDAYLIAPPFCDFIATPSEKYICAAAHNDITSAGCRTDTVRVAGRRRQT